MVWSSTSIRHASGSRWTVAAAGLTTVSALSALPDRLIADIFVF
jgi:hypothetical protein